LENICFRLRIAQEIKREQDEIDLKIKDLETRGVEIEKLLRGEGQNLEQLNETKLSHIGSSDEDLLKELLEIWRNITQLKKRDEELTIRQQELQLEHRHAQLKEELSMRLSCSSKFINIQFLFNFLMKFILFRTR
jgi:F-actin monooxygenase